MEATQPEVLYSVCQYLVVVSPTDRTGSEPHHPMLLSDSAAVLMYHS